MQPKPLLKGQLRLSRHRSRSKNDGSGRLRLRNTVTDRGWIWRQGGNVIIEICSILVPVRYRYCRKEKTFDYLIILGRDAASSFAPAVSSTKLTSGRGTRHCSMEGVGVSVSSAVFSGHFDDGWVSRSIRPPEENQTNKSLECYCQCWALAPLLATSRHWRELKKVAQVAVARK